MCISCRHLKMLLQQNPLLLAAFGMDTEMIKQEIEKAEALDKLKVQLLHKTDSVYSTIIMHTGGH